MTTKVSLAGQFNFLPLGMTATLSVRRPGLGKRAINWVRTRLWLLYPLVNEIHRLVEWFRDPQNF